LLKDADEDELLETVRALKRGESRLTPQIARKVMDQFRRLAAPASAAREPARKMRASPAPPYEADALTEKEERVLQHIAEGMSNRQIAATLYLAEGTVKNYVSRIMDKLHANTRTELALKCRRQN
jgi:DNA-binding NarL/FixJ family response regulator